MTEQSSKIERSFTVQETADILKVHPDTVRKFLNAGAIPPSGWYRIGRQIRIKESAVQALQNINEAHEKDNSI
jgi:excisionase family DNA binding protein